MSGVVKINITESGETLKSLLAQQKTALGKERVQALYLQFCASLSRLSGEQE